MPNGVGWCCISASVMDERDKAHFRVKVYNSYIIYYLEGKNEAKEMNDKLI